MRPLVFFGITGLVLTSACQDLAQPTNPLEPDLAVLLNENVDLVPITIPDPCSGEFVTISGKLHAVVASNLNPDGSTSFRLHINSARFHGEGTTARVGGERTGTKYRGQIKEHLSLALQPENGGFKTKDQTVIRLMRVGGPDPQAEDDLLVKTRFFVKDGNVQFLGAEAECGALGVG